MKTRTSGFLTGFVFGLIGVNKVGLTNGRARCVVSRCGRGGAPLLLLSGLLVSFSCPARGPVPSGRAEEHHSDQLNQLTLKLAARELGLKTRFSPEPRSVSRGAFG